jgi:Flp pilus assembly protein TadG
MNPMTRMKLRVRRSVHDLSGDNSGIAAVEFAMVVPLMLVLFFGTVEFSSALAIDRKVTIMSRTLSDLTSQNISITDAQAMLFSTPAPASRRRIPSPVNSTHPELCVDPHEGHAQWSKGAAARGRIHGRDRPRFRSTAAI